MKENLAYLPKVSPSLLGSDTLPFYYVYGYEGNSIIEAKATQNFNTYGVLYNWESAKISCPVGWHLPSDEGWKILEKNQGMTQIDSDLFGVRSTGAVAGKLKEVGTSHWNSPNTGATNRSGFTALPGGSRSPDGGFSTQGILGTFWSSSAYDTLKAILRNLSCEADAIVRNGDFRTYGLAVRCLKD
jgi:uncharacterized protein (TIGR02145 family)